ncbi:MAG: hypothetical protein AAF740_12580 [Bacteroidota bacterium]
MGGEQTVVGKVALSQETPTEVQRVFLPNAKLKKYFKFMPKIKETCYNPNLPVENQEVIWNRALVWTAVIKIRVYESELKLVDRAYLRRWLKVTDEKEIQGWQDLQNPNEISEEQQSSSPALSQYLMEFVPAGTSAESALAQRSFNMRVRRLGWINCDRLVRSYPNSTLLTNVEIEAKSAVTMIIEDYNSAAVRYARASGKTQFGQWPEGLAIVFISIADKNGQLTMALSETKVGDPQPPLVYERISEKELDEVLERYNL